MVSCLGARTTRQGRGWCGTDAPGGPCTAPSRLSRARACYGLLMFDSNHPKSGDYSNLIEPRPFAPITREMVERFFTEAEPVRYTPEAIVSPQFYAQLVAIADDPEHTLNDIALAMLGRR